LTPSSITPWIKISEVVREVMKVDFSGKNIKLYFFQSYFQKKEKP